MASGYHRVNGIADTSQLFYRLYQNGEKLPVIQQSFSCVDGDYSDYEEASFIRTESVPDRNQPSTLYTTFLVIIGTLMI